MHTKFSLVVASGLMLMAVSSPAGARPNLVQNADFSQFSSGAVDQWFRIGASLTDWSLNPAPGNKGTQGVVFSPGAADTTGAQFYFDPHAIHYGLWGPGNGAANGLPASSPAGGNYFGADDGVDRNGYRQVLSQTITGLTSHQEYKLSYYWAAAEVSTYMGATNNEVFVNFGGQNFEPAAATIASHGFSGWIPETVTFHANSASEVLAFTLGSLTSTGAPPIALLGAPSLTTVPEPATWAMMLAGFAGLGVAARLRRGKAVPVTAA